MKQIGLLIGILSIIICPALIAQDFLPPLVPWKGESEKLIVKKNHPWITPAEDSDFRFSPNYDETFAWIDKLIASSDMLKMVTIGASEHGKPIKMVIASSENRFSPDALTASAKPLILFQAGIHSGEIDGKDAGMMLLRDIVKGNKRHLLNDVNLLFVPILNVDGHERSSKYSRPNQRGPEKMGWRSNAKNLNLNRDYTKLETKGIQAIVGVMNGYEPDLYLDIHVTDGADYQYDITYGYNGDHAYSPAISNWLDTTFSPRVNKSLQEMGHIPGPLVFTVNDMDFQDGFLVFDSSPRYSDGYGNARHLPSILIENHSLKPFRQRVLGTYVFLAAAIEVVAAHKETLRAAISGDRNRKTREIPLAFKAPTGTPDSLLLMGIASKRVLSELTGDTIVQWLGESVTQRVAVVDYNEPDVSIIRPEGYWVPSSYPEIIKKLRQHGIEMEVISEPRTVDVEMYRIVDPQLAAKSFEGRVRVSGDFEAEMHQETFYPGAAYVSTDQPLGDLAVILLEPGHPDSFFQWGYFLEILERTEYVESYFMEPYAKKMLAEDPALKAEFEEKMKTDAAFKNDTRKILQWFYSKSPYYDARHLLYPVGRDL